MTVDTLGAKTRIDDGKERAGQTRLTLPRGGDVGKANEFAQSHDFADKNGLTGRADVADTYRRKA